MGIPNTYKVKSIFSKEGKLLIPSERQDIQQQIAETQKEKRRVAYQKGLQTIQENREQIIDNPDYRIYIEFETDEDMEKFFKKLHASRIKIAEITTADTSEFGSRSPTFYKNKDVVPASDLAGMNSAYNKFVQIARSVKCKYDIYG